MRIREIGNRKGESLDIGKMPNYSWKFLEAKGRAILRA